MTRPTLREELQSIAELGGVFLDVEQKFRGADFTGTLTDFIPQIEQEERAVFAQERSPGGVPWPPLSEYTIRKKGHAKKLYESGDMFAAMVDHTAPHHVGGVTHRGLVFGTDLPYAEFHQDGTSRIPQREFAGLSEETVDRLVNRAADDAVDTLKYTIRG